MPAQRTLSQVRRTQILKAAVETIGQRGLADTRITDVAGRAGTSAALLIYYFGTKDRLLAKALAYSEERFYERTERELAALPTATDRLMRLIELSCSIGADGEERWLDEWVLWLDLWARAPHDPDVARDREAMDRRFREAIAELVQGGQETGEFGPVEPSEFALRLAALIDGLAIQVVLGDPEVSAEADVRRLRAGGVGRAGVRVAGEGKPTDAPGTAKVHGGTGPGRDPPAPGGAGMSARTPHRAPIDPALLEPVTRPLGRSRILPGEAYTSDAVLGWEREHFFDDSWVCVGRATSLASAGDQAAVRAGEEGILLVRGDDGVLRGFFNVCRHRGHELLPCGAGGVNRRAIRCPYHAWVYGLDGTLRSNPKFDELDADDPVHDGLVPARVEEWHGWVFVNASGHAPAVREHLGATLERLLARYRPRDLVPAAAHTYEVAANWKTIVENYHECYHCTQIHPELCKVTPPDSGENYEPDGAWAGGSMELMDHAETMSLTGRSGSEPLPGLTDEERRYVHYVGLFPNLLVSAHPDYVMTHRLEALAPGRTVIECQWLFPPSALARPGFDPSYAVDFWDLTNRQDWAACESVQRGLASRGYRQGPLSSAEGAVHQFMCIVANGYQSGVVAAPRTREPAG